MLIGAVPMVTMAQKRRELAHNTQTHSRFTVSPTSCLYAEFSPSAGTVLSAEFRRSLILLALFRRPISSADSWGADLLA